MGEGSLCPKPRSLGLRSTDPCPTNSMKKTKKFLSPKPRNAAPRIPTHEAIAIRAANMWHQWGCPKWRDDEIWLQAERELRASPNARNNDPRNFTLMAAIPIQGASISDAMSELAELYPGHVGQDTTSI